MVDLHTHILPNMDDGSKSVEMSLKMLAAEAEQGVDTVVLTPHCYRNREEIGSFLHRRTEAYHCLLEALDQNPVEGITLRLGAEVAWAPNMADWTELCQLCTEGTRNLLLELPFRPWQEQMIDQIYDLMARRSVVPVFAHLERYTETQRPELIDQIIRIGAPIQLSCAPLQHIWTRRSVMRILKREQNCLLASDCHNLDRRPPNMKVGMNAVRKRFGVQMEQQLVDMADSLV